MAQTVPQARDPQTMAYPAQHATVGTSTETSPELQRMPPSAATGTVAVLDIDDEEDTSRGDFFDHTTPREISMSRYKQNHEWMEEILSSPYSINQIIPADLGSVCVVNLQVSQMESSMLLSIPRKMLQNTLCWSLGS
jgi:hypothetical protein